MPAYPWLIEKYIDLNSTPVKIRAMQKIGVPYPAGFDQIANAELDKQAVGIASNLANQGVPGIDRNKQIVALIAYLQRLGTDIKAGGK